jgi:hypothetical protein
MSDLLTVAQVDIAIAGSQRIARGI